MDKNKLKKLREMMDFLNEGLTRKDFDNFSKQVVDLIKLLIKKHVSVQELATKIETNNTEVNDKLNRQITAELESLLRRFSKKSKDIDSRLGSILDARNLDEDRIIESVLGKVKLPEYKETILDDPIKLRDKLESLLGDDELKLTALEEFAKRIEALESRPLAGKTPYGGSVVHKFMDDKDTLTGDGTTKAFILTKTPINGSLKLFRGGALQDEGTGDDYVLSNKTVTFKSAPAVGEKLKTFYRHF